MVESTLTTLVVPYDERPQGIAPGEFDSIVRMHQRRIYRVLLLLVRDSDAADSLTQECFLRAFAKRTSFRGQASLETWLIRIAINLARDHVKSRRRAFWRRLVRGDKAVERDLTAARASPEALFLIQEQVAAVWSAAEGLSPQQRAVFFLRFSEEMALEEIAVAMGLEVGTVKSHLSRAIATVRLSLQK
jgi:RNA polymerase sigma-70 factor, ECF subfamily